MGIAYKLLQKLPPEIAAWLLNGKSGSRAALWDAVCRVMTSQEARRDLQVAVRISLGRTKVTVRTKPGKMRVDLRDRFVSRNIFKWGIWEPNETRLIEQLTRPGDVFLDIGAHYGYFTLLGARAVGERGRVVAIEPHPSNFELLAENVRLNKLYNVVGVNVALGHRTGKATMYEAKENLGDHRLIEVPNEERRSLEVSETTGDELLESLGIDAVDFIKMDVQGYEQRVIEGLKNVLARSKSCCILTEFWPYGIKRAGGDPKELFGCVTNGIRRAYLIDDCDSLVESTYEQVLRIAQQRGSETSDSAYVNVLFAPQERIVRQQARHKC